jgi:hypothetical protein
MTAILYVDGIGLSGPGLDGWAQGAAVLRGEQPWSWREPAPHVPQLLPANERRRATASVRLAFRVAEEAVAAAGQPALGMASVFASADADSPILHRTCLALADAPQTLSPTDFHNSVHNAALGYWSIATGSRLPSVSLSAADASFAAALGESVTLALSESLPVLLVAFDLQAPPFLANVLEHRFTNAVALVLGVRRSAASIAALEVEPAVGDPTRMSNPDLEKLRSDGTAMRALPLLELLSLGRPGPVFLGGPGSLGFQLTVLPC